MSFFDFNWPAFRELTFGTGGIGKTTAFLARLVKQRAKVVWIYDHKHEFCRKLRVDPVYTVAQLCLATMKGGYVCFDPIMQFEGEKKEGFRFFCDFVYKASGEFRGRKLLVADEIQYLHDSSKKPKELLLCLDDGRCRQLDFMGIAQGPNLIFHGIRSQVTECYTFRVADGNAVHYLQKDYGFNADEVRGLKPGQWLWRDLNGSAPTRKGGSAFSINAKRK